MVFILDVSACSGYATLLCPNILTPRNTTHNERWQYDPKTGNCNNFQYRKICPLHQNAFESREECVLVCNDSPLRYHEDISPPLSRKLNKLLDIDKLTPSDDLSSSYYDDIDFFKFRDFNVKDEHEDINDKLIPLITNLHKKPQSKHQ